MYGQPGHHGWLSGCRTQCDISHSASRSNTRIRANRANRILPPAGSHAERVCNLAAGFHLLVLSMRMHI